MDDSSVLIDILLVMIILGKDLLDCKLFNVFLIVVNGCKLYLGSL